MIPEDTATQAWSYGVRLGQNLWRLVLWKGVCVCVCAHPCQWMDARRRKSTQGWSLSQLADTNLPKSSRKKPREIWQESRVQIAKRGYKAPFSLHKTCNELEGLGGAEKQISCLCCSPLSARFATVLQCVRIYIHMFVNPFFSTLRGFYTSDLNLCHMVSQTVQLQTAGGGRQRWRAVGEGGLRGTHRNSVLILGRSFPQNPLKGRKALVY